MFKLFTEKEHPLRVYVDHPSEQELVNLLRYFRLQYYVEQEHPSEVVDNLLFLDAERKLLHFPVGLKSLVIGELTKLHYPYADFTETPEAQVFLNVEEVNDSLLDGITLRDYQVNSIKKAVEYKRGLIQVSTGGGKTEIVLALIRFLLDRGKKRVLLCVPSTKLMYQTRLRALNRGFTEAEVSMYGDGVPFDPESKIIVATVQTLFRRLEDEEFQNWYNGLDMLVMDEAHHCSARTFYGVVDKLSPEYIIGVTAEPFYRDKDHLIQDLLIRGLMGPVLYRITVPELVALGYLSKPYLISVETTCPKKIFEVINWSVVNKEGIVQNKPRNSLITSIAAILVRHGKNPLILIQQINHGVTLANKLAELGFSVALLTGGGAVEIYRGLSVEQIKDPEGDTLKQFTDGQIDVLIGTSVLDEGADIPCLSAVILAGGGKSPLKVVQRVGRGLRPKPGDNTTVIIDFVDGFNVVTRSHAKKRKEILSTLDIESFYIADVLHLEEVLIGHLENFKADGQRRAQHLANA